MNISDWNRCPTYLGWAMVVQCAASLAVPGSARCTFCWFPGLARADLASASSTLIEATDITHAPARCMAFVVADLQCLSGTSSIRARFQCRLAQLTQRLSRVVPSLHGAHWTDALSDAEPAAASAAHPSAADLDIPSPMQGSLLCAHTVHQCWKRFSGQ
jgi:hypothetical protein